MRSPDKRTLTMHIERELYAKAVVRAAELGLTLTSFVRGLVAEATENVTLTSAEIRRIAEATEYEERRQAKISAMQKRQRRDARNDA